MAGPKPLSTESGVHQRLESCAELHQNDVISRSDGYLLGSARQCISPGLFRLSWIWKRSSPQPALGRGSRRIGWGGGHGTVWSTAGNFQGLLRPRTRSRSREGWSKHHIWSLTRFNFVGLWGTETKTKESLGGIKEKNFLPQEGSLICPPDKWMIL